MPKQKQNRTEKVTIRLTPDELHRLRELSYGSYRLMADYCRDCIFGREITVVPGFDEAAEQLRRIGTNLNQLTRLAKTCNSTHIFRSAADVFLLPAAENGGL